MLEGVIAWLLPHPISFLELSGILIVLQSGAFAIYEYVLTAFFHRRVNFQTHFGRGLVAALEFKTAAEILKTVLVRELSELLVLGAVILLRAVLSLLIHYEMRHGDRDTQEEEKM